jgi:hypothetical protein
LALQVVAALLADEPERPVTELAAELAEAGSRLEALAYEEVRVRAAFELSYRTLEAAQARLFGCCRPPRAQMSAPRLPPCWSICQPRASGRGWRRWPGRICSSTAAHRTAGRCMT